ncbi:MAG: hypothetical protein IJ184_07280 [Alphaproteobacteria bacterium]|nr:hypothetical protein [Alphaproteobacteria bacterium]
MKRLRKKIIYLLQYKGIYILRKVTGTKTVFVDGLGGKYSLIRKKNERQKKE